MIDPSNQNGAGRVTNLFDGPLLVDLKLERDVLGTLCLKPHLIDGIDLVERDFEGTAHRTLWAAILEVYQNEGTCDSVRLRSHLLDKNLLQRVGGEDALQDLFDNVIPDGSLQTARLRRLSILRRLRVNLVFHAKNIHDPDACAKYEAEAERYRAELQALDRKEGSGTHRLDAMWKSLGEWGVLDQQPEPQDWVLMRPDTETNNMANPIGLLPRSEVGFILGAGGLGKSFLCTQLALSVATGRKWLDHFLVPKPGKVLIILGEEKLKQAHRRIYELSHAMRLTDEQRALARERIVMMPLSGIIAPFVVQDGKTTAETDVVPWLRARMASGEWTLIIIDPLARFAGADSEKDNGQATTFMQVIETLCALPGAPTVLLVHHSNKGSRGEDSGAPSASDGRGSSALTDGSRWCANLSKRVGGANLTITKNNYSADWSETTPLERAYGGYLRVMPIEKQRAEARLKPEEQRDVRDQVLRFVGKKPGSGRDEIRKAVRRGQNLVTSLLAEMVEDGELVKGSGDAYYVPQNKEGGDAE